MSKAIGTWVRTLGVLLVLSTSANAQTEFFDSGERVYSGGWYYGASALGVKEGHADVLDATVAVTPETALSFGIGRMRPSGGLADVHTLSLDATYLASRSSDATPWTAKLGVGLHYGSGNPNDVVAGRFSVEVAATMQRSGRVLVAPWLGGSSDVIVSGPGEFSSAVAAGLGVGVQAMRDLVLFVRPGYRLLTSGDAAPGFGVRFGIAVID